MKSFVAIVALVGVAIAAPQDPEIGVRAPSTFQNCDCQCDSYTWTSKGRILGNCLSPDATGANFCYISGRATRACRDVQISESRAESFSNRGKFYSYEACATPPRNQCFGSGGPGANFGDGDFGAGGGFGGGFGGRPGGFGGRPGGFGGEQGGFGGEQGGFSGQQFGGQQGGFGARPPQTNLASILGIRAAGATGDDAIQA